MMAPSSISRVPKRELSTVTVDIWGNCSLGSEGRGGDGMRAVLAQEVHEGRLHERRSRAESGLVGGGLGIQVDEGLGDVDVLGVGQLPDGGLLALLEARQRGVQALGAGAVGRTQLKDVVDVAVELVDVAADGVAVAGA